jgi:hypothetical protein
MLMARVFALHQIIAETFFLVYLFFFSDYLPAVGW